MSTNLTRKEQKDKWLALNKQSFVDDLLSAKPKDYQERNLFYQQISQWLSYPLQLISILAGSYLLFGIAHEVWGWGLNSPQGIGIFIACVMIFLGVECVRRWLVNTTGYNYFATLKVTEGRLKKGEWIKSNLYCLVVISMALVASGTLGVYKYIKSNIPEASTIDIQEVTSPLEQKIRHERNSIQAIDRDLSQLMQSKKNELKDPRSYSVWNGREFLLSEVKERHKNYDRQIQSMQSQRQKHQALILQYENKLQDKEQSTASKNSAISLSHATRTEIHASVTAGIWLIFEILLVFMLSYHWMYLYASKREKLLEKLALQKAMDTTHSNVQQPEQENLYAQTSLSMQQNGLNPYFSENTYAPNLESPSPTHQNTQQKEIGFEKWYLNPKKPQTPKPEIQKETEVIIKEVEVPVIQEVIKEVFVEREKEKSKKNTDGFPVTCAYCGKKEMKQRPAKYCSNSCRNKAWKEKKNQSRAKK